MMSRDKSRVDNDQTSKLRKHVDQPCIWWRRTDTGHVVALCADGRVWTWACQSMAAAGPRQGDQITTDAGGRQPMYPKDNSPRHPGQIIGFRTCPERWWDPFCLTKSSTYWKRGFPQLSQKPILLCWEEWFVRACVWGGVVSMCFCHILWQRGVV